MTSVIQQRLLDFATDIASALPEELTFQHSIMAQCALPASRPPDDILTHESRQGRAHLLLEAGKALNPSTGRWEQLGLPYGAKSRLLLMHLNSEAVRRQSPIIPVEDTMTAFFRRLMGRTQDGRQTRMLKSQLSALAAAQFRMGIANLDNAVQVNAQIVGAFNLWFEKDENQRVLWPSTLRLSTDYFESLTRFAVPLDERAIAALAHSAIALDVYCWLAQRLHRIPLGNPQFVPWQAVYEQFGQGYNRIRKFRLFFSGIFPQVMAVYPDAKVSYDARGLQLWNSPPPVKKRLVAVGSRAIGRAEGEHFQGD